MFTIYPHPLPILRMSDTVFLLSLSLSPCAFKVWTGTAYYLLLLLFIHYLQLRRHTVVGAIACHISTDYEDFSTLKFR